MTALGIGILLGLTVGLIVAFECCWILTRNDWVLTHNELKQETDDSAGLSHLPSPREGKTRSPCRETDH